MKTSRTMLLLATLALFGCGGEAAAPAHEETGDTHDGAHAPEGEAPPGHVTLDPTMLRDLRLTTAAVERRTDDTRVTALGDVRVDASRTAEVDAPLGARVVRLLAAAGDDVTAGQPLAELESPDLARARAELATARARATAAVSARERKSGLAGGGVVSQGDIEHAQAEAVDAEAAVSAARATLVALGIDPEADDGEGGRWLLPAPRAGTVLAREVIEGHHVDVGDILFRLSDLSRVWLVAHASERDGLRVRLGGTAEATFVALPGETLSGVVTSIGLELEPGTRTLPVRIELPNPDGRLRPGLAASVRLPLAGTGAELLAVPAAALQRVSDRWTVFLPAGEATFEARAVARGRDFGNEVEILSGLAEGEPVVVEGAFLLRAEMERRADGGEHHDH